MSEIAWRHYNVVVNILDGTYTPNGILTWLTTCNRNLDNERPVDLIDNNTDADTDRVFAEARRVAAI